MIQQTLFDIEPQRTEIKNFVCPRGYKGLAAFHKYWGKKPTECLSFMIENLTEPGDIVFDPFLGSGLIARESLDRKRRFIGTDINPASIEMARFIVSPPSVQEYSEALKDLEKRVKNEIEKSYLREDGNIATHYLWENETLKSVWFNQHGQRGRIERKPDKYDLTLLARYQNYHCKYLREIELFENSRINTKRELKLGDIFTGRALRNIDILLQHIEGYEETLKKAFMLTLTAASGQMSNMVFAVTNRGKINGKKDERICVGSWVIGYWRPKLHFEVNVWSCFHNRARKIIKGLKDVTNIYNNEHTSDITDFYKANYDCALVNSDARKVVSDMPNGSIKLLLTDPPHSDRIPYLELSEMWNTILGYQVDFDNEIVVSNARGRHKGKDSYNQDMYNLLVKLECKMCAGGIIALIFNARDADSWRYIKEFSDTSSTMSFRGCFDIAYSANSVVQDNRKGGMKHDYVILFEKRGATGDSWQKITSIPGWSDSFPEV